MLIHGTRADGATAGQGHAGLADARQQRPQAEHRGPHGAHQVVGGFGQQSSRRGLNPLFLIGAGTAQHVQQPERGVNVAQIRHVGERDRLAQQDGCEQNGQGRVFGTADVDAAGKGHAAFNDQLVHMSPGLVGTGRPSVTGKLRQRRFFSKENPELIFRKIACQKSVFCVRDYFRGGSSSVGRAPGCGPGGRGFKSHLSPHKFAPRPLCHDAGFSFGAWRSLVAHLLWEQGVEGSNPFAPTNISSPYDKCRKGFSFGHMLTGTQL